MSHIVFATGGARSGKSSFAESQFADNDNVLYIATAIGFDDEMKDRIARHREGRNPEWVTIESYSDLHRVVDNHSSQVKGILIDCVTIMVTNLMMDETTDWDNMTAQRAAHVEKKIDNQFNMFMKSLKKFSGRVVIVSNELGMGLVPSTTLGRYFRDIAGRVNQKIARESDQVYLLVSGIAVKIK